MFSPKDFAWRKRDTHKVNQVLQSESLSGVGCRLGPQAAGVVSSCLSNVGASD